MIDSPYRTEQLVALAEGYAEHRRLSLSRVSSIVRNDGKFFDALKTGSDCRMRTFFEVLAWFDGHWPEKLRWPSDVPRPSSIKLRRSSGAAHAGAT